MIGSCCEIRAPGIHSLDLASFSWGSIEGFAVGDEERCAETSG